MKIKAKNKLNKIEQKVKAIKKLLILLLTSLSINIYKRNNKNSMDILIITTTITTTLPTTT